MNKLMQEREREHEHSSCNAPPLPPPILPDIADNCTLTSPVPTQSVACFTDSAADTGVCSATRRRRRTGGPTSRLWRWKRTIDPPGNPISKAS